MKRICVIGCGKKKRPERAPARDLYIGSLFRDSLFWAERRRFDQVLVLSAAHAIVELHAELAPYELQLRDLDAEGRRVIGEVSRATLRRLADGPADLTILAGADYAELLRPLAAEGWTVREPLAGMTLGARRAWFGRRRATKKTTALANAAYDLLPALEAAEADGDEAAGVEALRTFLRIALPMLKRDEVAALHVEAVLAVEPCKSRAARLLGVSRRSVYNMIERRAVAS